MITEAELKAYAVDIPNDIQAIMSRYDLYIIESRNPDGSLKFDGPQPESFFGFQAAKRIFAAVPNATLDGGSIALWPKLINDSWIARKKTW